MCAVRLTRLRLDSFGPFKFQEIELAPLTILFGANGAGKSTVLQAIEEALTLSGGQGPMGWQSSSAVVYATLDDRSIPESSDERIMRHVLWKDLEGIIDKKYSLTDPYADCPSLKNLLVRKATEMIRSGPHGTLEARTRIAAHLLRHSVLAFGGLQRDTDGSWGLVCFASLDEVAEFADLIDSLVIADETEYVSDSYVDVDDDELLMAVKMLLSGEDVAVTKEWGDSQGTAMDMRLDYSRTLFGKIRPLPMKLDFESVTLDFELEKFAGRIASRLTSSSRHTGDLPWLIACHPPEFESTGESGDERNAVPAQTWAATTNAEERASYRLVPREFDEYVVSPLIRSAVERIASHANSIAPSFLTEDSQIDIEFLDPSMWRPDAPRLRATMRQDGMKIPLARMGSGIARWVSYSIRLASQELLAGTVIGDPSMESDVVSHKGVQYLRHDVATTYAGVAALEVLPGNLDVVLLIDEPEAHLHPRAVASVGQWLLDIAPRVASVVVATHHPSLFNLRDRNIQKIQKHVVFKKGKASSSVPWDPESEDLVAQLARDIGLTPGDRFLMSRYVLFVEGPHDLVIREELFGEVLKGCLIRLLPLHGAHNISLIATSEIVWQMGIPIGVLTDDTNIERVKRGERSNHMEKLVDRMLREAKAEGRMVDAFGLALDDVLFYLDDEVTATFAKEGFPGWRAARTIWGDRDQPATVTANGSKFKEWITNTYGLQLDRDSVRSMARKCKAEGKILEELANVVTEVVSRTV